MSRKVERFGGLIAWRKVRVLTRRICLVTVFLLCIMLCAISVEAGESLLSSYRDGACFRGMKVVSFGRYTSLRIRNSKPEIMRQPLSGDGILLQVKFTHHGLCTKGHYKLSLRTSEGLEIYGRPSKNALSLIEKGYWPEKDWYSDLMWTFKSSKKAYQKIQWVSINLLDVTSGKKVLGGKVSVNFSIGKSEKLPVEFQYKKYTGIYLDYPNDISWLNERYGTSFNAGEGKTSFDIFSKLNIHFVVVNKIGELFSKGLSSREITLLKKEANNFFNYIKRVRPDVNIWLAVPSWKFEIPSRSLKGLITWVNAVDEIDGLVLDWETNPSMLEDVPAKFQLVRSLLNKQKKFICTPTSFIGRRGLNWNEVDSLHLACDMFLPMFYVPQQDKFLITAKRWLDSWTEPENKPSSPIVPLLIPIHKVTDNTPMPPSLMKYTIALINQYNIPGFFVYRPYAVTLQTQRILSRVYGSYDVDFSFTKTEMEIRRNLLKVRGFIINEGETEFSGLVPMDLIFNDEKNNIVFKRRLQVSLNDGHHGSFHIVVHDRDLGSVFRIKQVELVIDPCDIYKP
ncbi:MAG: hypothetical protein D6732_26425, partial [Methanobacteriota archaeon]